MIKNGLFHKLVGFPAGATAPFVGEYSIRLGDHAKCAQNSDDGIVNGVQDGETLIVEARDIVEVEVTNGAAVKAVVRLGYSDTQDVCFALLAPVGGVAFVKTFWLNSANDNHRSLNRSKYSRP